MDYEIILRNRPEYRLVLSRRGRTRSWLKSGNLTKHSLVISLHKKRKSYHFSSRHTEVKYIAGYLSSTHDEYLAPYKVTINIFGKWRGMFYNSITDTTRIIANEDFFQSKFISVPYLLISSSFLIPWGSRTI